MTENRTTNAMGAGYRDWPNRGRHYIDMRGLQDDNAILRNPHKGWYWHYIDQGVSGGNYRQDHNENDLLLDFPGLHHLYLRVDWADLEPREGIFHWTLMDEIFEKWGAAGYRFVFRVCSYCARGRRGPLTTPAWVFDAGAKYTDVGGDWEPDYGDPVYLEKTAGFLAAFGKRYNGHPLVEAVDIGSYGTWGEGHTGYGSDKVWPLEIMKKHIAMHSANFPDTLLLMNDDFVNHRGICEAEENASLVEYARGLGVGLRDDSVSVASYKERFGYSTLRTPHMFDYFKDVAPIDLELEHYHMVKPDYLKDGLPFLDAMIRTGCTYAGFHGYPRPWLDTRRYLTEYMANRLGYWYFIEGVDLPEAVSGGACLITLYMSNRGFAKSYKKFDSYLRLKNQSVSGAEINIRLDVDNRTWLPGETATPVKISLKNVPSGRYEVALGMFERDRPIQMGMDIHIESAGYYILTNKISVCFNFAKKISLFIINRM